jgi:hypothetical protein
MHETPKLRVLTKLAGELVNDQVSIDLNGNVRLERFVETAFDQLQSFLPLRVWFHS